MPTVAQIRTEIVTRIAGIPEIGKVNDRERYAKDIRSLMSFYGGATPEELRGWYVHRTASRRETPTLHRTNVWHRWQIRGFLGFVDAEASEHLMDVLAEAIVATLGADETLGGLIAGQRLALGSVDAGGVQIVEIGPALMADAILVHAADLSLVTWHVE